MYYPKTAYQFEGFEKSIHRHKKYDAILRNKKSGRRVRVPFGDASYAQYKDSTGLGLYTKLNHNDLKRRARYRQRHINDVKSGFYSPGYMSWYYLW